MIHALSNVHHSNRRDCEVMAGELFKANIAALAYHAGLKDDERSTVQQRWVQENRCKVHIVHVHVPVLVCVHVHNQSI